MNPDEIKSLAVNFKPMPEHLNAAEQLYFVTMRTLSADFRAKRMSAEQARKEGRMARREFDRNASDIRLWKHSAQLWKNIEMAAMRFTKEHTIEAADEFFRTVYGLGENWRAVRPLAEIQKEEDVK